MPAALIKVIGLADGTAFGKDMWVESYDVNTEPDPSCVSFFRADGVGVLNGAVGGRTYITPYRERAQRFQDAAAAMRAWCEASTTRPLRPDGKSNRPLTVLTVEIEPA
jgi:hypothetical protein